MVNNKTIIDNIVNIAFIVIQKQDFGKTTVSIRGTGVIIQNNKLVSCNHIYTEIIQQHEEQNLYCGILETSETQTNHVQTYKVFKLKKDKVFLERDLILFDIVDYNGKKGVPNDIFMAEKDMTRDKLLAEEIYMVGFPLGTELLAMNMGITLTVNKGIISQLKFNNKDNKIDFFLTDKQINPGGSGSPVFYNDKIIGLSTGTINQVNKIGEKTINIPSGVGIIRPSNYILDLLNS